MKNVFSTAMHQATQLTREQNVTEATRVIQRALSGRGHALSPDEQSPESSRLIELQTNVAESFGSGSNRLGKTPELRALACGMPQRNDAPRRA